MLALGLAAEIPAQELKSYAPIKTAYLRPWGTGKFSLYVRKGQGLVLFATRGGAFTQEQLRRLRAGGPLDERQVEALHRDLSRRLVRS